jgi:hypothetical protein
MNLIIFKFFPGPTILYFDFHQRKDDRMVVGFTTTGVISAYHH